MPSSQSRWQAQLLHEWSVHRDTPTRESLWAQYEHEIKKLSEHKQEELLKKLSEC